MTAVNPSSPSQALFLQGLEPILSPDVLPFDAELQAILGQIEGHEPIEVRVQEIALPLVAESEIQNNPNHQKAETALDQLKKITNESMAAQPSSSSMGKQSEANAKMLEAVKKENEATCFKKINNASFVALFQSNLSALTGLNTLLKKNMACSLSMVTQQNTSHKLHKVMTEGPLPSDHYFLSSLSLHDHYESICLMNQPLTSAVKSEPKQVMSLKMQQRVFLVKMKEQIKASIYRSWFAQSLGIVEQEKELAKVSIQKFWEYFIQSEPSQQAAIVALKARVEKCQQDALKEVAVQFPNYKTHFAEKSWSKELESKVHQENILKINILMSRIEIAFWQDGENAKYQKIFSICKTHFIEKQCQAIFDTIIKPGLYPAHS